MSKAANGSQGSPHFGKKMAGGENIYGFLNRGQRPSQLFRGLEGKNWKIDVREVWDRNVDGYTGVHTKYEHSSTHITPTKSIHHGRGTEKPSRQMT